MQHAHSVFEVSETLGKWWLPDSPDRLIDGVLKGSDAEGYRLTLRDSLESGGSLAERFGRRDPGFVKVIFGEAASGLVTLFDPFRTASTHSFRGLITETWYAPLVVKGAHLKARDQLRFSKVRAKFSVLCDWIDATVFDVTQEKGQLLSIGFAFPEVRKLYECDEFVVSLDFSVRRPGRRRGQNQVSVEWEPQLRLESKGVEMAWEGTPGWNCSSIIYALNSFLSVATFDTSYPFDIVGQTEQFEEEVAGKSYKTGIHLNQEQRLQAPQYDVRNALFSWKDIEATCGEHFQQWLAIFPRLRGPIVLFLDSRARRNIYSPERFFNMVMALEGLHRFLYPTASNATGRRHEPSLVRRLSDLFRDVEHLACWFMGAKRAGTLRKKRYSKVIDAIKEARNRLAHALPEEGDDPAGRYYHFTILAEHLMAMHLMRLIGISGDRIHERMTKNYFTRQYREAIVEFFDRELFRRAQGPQAQ